MDEYWSSKVMTEPLQGCYSGGLINERRLLTDKR